MYKNKIGENSGTHFVEVVEGGCALQGTPGLHSGGLLLLQERLVGALTRGKLALETGEGDVVVPPVEVEGEGAVGFGPGGRGGPFVHHHHGDLISELRVLFDLQARHVVGGQVVYFGLGFNPFGAVDLSSQVYRREGPGVGSAAAGRHNVRGAPGPLGGFPRGREGEEGALVGGAVLAAQGGVRGGLVGAAGVPHTRQGALGGERWWGGRINYTIYQGIIMLLLCVIVIIKKV